MQNSRLELPGLGKCGKPFGLMGTGTGSAQEEAAHRVCAPLLDRSKPLLQSKTRPLACYPDQLLILDRAHCSWTEDDIMGILLMDIKAPFPTVARRRLIL